MVPISDNISNRRKPIVIYWLIGINITLFLFEIKLEVNEQLGTFINSWGVIPALFSEAIANFLAGNLAAGVVVVMRSTSLFIGMFLHISFSQILGNMIFLTVFGKTIEDNLGRWRFLGFYWVSGILTGLVQILMTPTLSAPIIGANGAISSLLGAYILKFPKVKIDTILPLAVIFLPVEIPAYFYVFWWLVQQIFYSIGSLNISGNVNPRQVDFLAQIVGLFIGVVLMRLLNLRNRTL